MKKKILVTSTDVMMYQFLIPHVKYLTSKGYIVDVACSYADGYRKEDYHTYIKMHIPSESSFYSVDLNRSPVSAMNRKGLKELKKIINGGMYDLIWTNEPVMSVVTRIASRTARKRGTVVMYMAHGFHFFSGAPLRNWLYYPIEKIMSYQCDAICLINWEDYYFAKRHLANIKYFHIDGIGLNVMKYSNVFFDRNRFRSEYGIRENDILIISVGELMPRKNHESFLRAVGRIKDNRIKYMICGLGELEAHLKNVANEIGMEKRLYLIGHVYNIPELLKASDIFAHPSLREGLGIAALEAMAAGLPLITTDVGGIKDYAHNGKTALVVKPYDINGFVKAIKTLVRDKEMRLSMGKNNSKYVKKYDISIATKNVYSIVKGLL